MKKPCIITDRKNIHDGFLKIQKVSTINEQTKKVNSFEVIVKQPAAAILARYEHQYCLLKQYRVAIDDWHWEIPAGLIEPDETPADAIIREAQEETGMIISVTSLLELDAIQSSVGYTNEIVYLYHGVADSIGETNRGDDEYIQVYWKTMDELLEMIKSGEIADTKTIAAIFHFSLKT